MSTPVAHWPAGARWRGPGQSALCRTAVRDVVTLLMKSRRSISKPMGVRVTRGMSALSGLQTSYARALLRAFLTSPTESVVARSALVSMLATVTPFPSFPLTWPHPTTGAICRQVIAISCCARHDSLISRTPSHEARSVMPINDTSAFAALACRCRQSTAGVRV